MAALTYTDYMMTKAATLSLSPVGVFLDSVFPLIYADNTTMLDPQINNVSAIATTFSSKYTTSVTFPDGETVTSRHWLGFAPSGSPATDAATPWTAPSEFASMLDTASLTTPDGMFTAVAAKTESFRLRVSYDGTGSGGARPQTAAAAVRTGVAASTDSTADYQLVEHYADKPYHALVARALPVPIAAAMLIRPFDSVAYDAGSFPAQWYSDLPHAWYDGYMQGQIPAWVTQLTGGNPGVLYFPTMFPESRATAYDVLSSYNNDIGLNSAAGDPDINDPGLQLHNVDVSYRWLVRCVAGYMLFDDGTRYDLTAQDCEAVTEDESAALSAIIGAQSGVLRELELDYMLPLPCREDTVGGVSFTLNSQSALPRTSTGSLTVTPTTNVHWRYRMGHIIERTTHNTTTNRVDVSIRVLGESGADAEEAVFSLTMPYEYVTTGGAGASQRQGQYVGTAFLVVNPGPDYTDTLRYYRAVKFFKNLSNVNETVADKANRAPITAFFWRNVLPLGLADFGVESVREQYFSLPLRELYEKFFRASFYDLIQANPNATTASGQSPSYGNFPVLPEIFNLDSVFSAVRAADTLGVDSVGTQFALMRTDMLVAVNVGDLAQSPSQNGTRFLRGYDSVVIDLRDIQFSETMYRPSSMLALGTVQAASNPPPVF